MYLENCLSLVLVTNAVSSSSCIAFLSEACTLQTVFQTYYNLFLWQKESVCLRNLEWVFTFQETPVHGDSSFNLNSQKKKFTVQSDNIIFLFLEQCDHTLVFNFISETQQRKCKHNNNYIHIFYAYNSKYSKMLKTILRKSLLHICYKCIQFNYDQQRVLRRLCGQRKNYQIYLK